MEKEPKICFIALIDIMGFSYYTKTTAFSDVYNFLSGIVETVEQLNEHVAYDIEIFSDTIILSISQEDSAIAKFIDYVNKLQLASIISDKLGVLPLRGAITVGEYFTNKQSIMFGKSLVEVHEKEKGLAIYPRIIVNKDLLPPNIYPWYADKAAGAFNRYLGRNISMVRQSLRLREDFDGTLHCNYLGTLVPSLVGGQSWDCDRLDKVSKHKKFIESNLKHKLDDKLKQKYEWMRSYHNWFCSEYDELREYCIFDEVTP